MPPRRNDPLLAITPYPPVFCPVFYY